MMKPKHRREQDYWLSFSGGLTASKADREEFFAYDSRGAEIAEGNPILRGKRWHGVAGAMLRESYLSQDGSWTGGAELTKDYAQRDFGLRSLREWFGDAVVKRWQAA